MESNPLHYPTADLYLKEVGIYIEVKGTKFKIDGSAATNMEVLFAKKLDKELTSICKDKEDLGFVCMKDVDKVAWIKGFAKYILDQHVEETKKKVLENQGNVHILNIVDTGEIKLVDNLTGLIIKSKDLSLQSYKNKFKKSEWDELITMAPQAIRTFQPSRHESSWYGDYIGETYSYKNILHLQKYPLPKWVLETKPSDYPNELPPLYKTFIEGLIPKEDQRHLYFSWKKNCYFYTNQTALVLSGLSSTGKSIEANIAQFAFIGDSSRAAPNEFATSRFNWLLKDSRLLTFDEVGLKRSQEVQTFKRMMNKTQMLNKKGVETEENMEVNCNFMVTCNDLPFNIKPTERKFQFIEITDKRLQTYLSKKEISNLVNLLENDLDFQAQIGWYFYNYKTDISPYDDAVKGPKFWEVLFRSLQYGFIFAYHLYGILSNMSKGSTIDESTLTKKTATIANKYLKATSLPNSIIDWNEELKSEGRAIFERYTEDGVKKIRNLIGQEDASDFDDLDDL